MKTTYFVLIIFFITAMAKAQDSFAIYQRAEIKLSPSHTYNQLVEEAIVVDHVIHRGDIAIIGEFAAEDILRAKALGYDVHILVEDVKANFLQKNQDKTAQRNPFCDSEISYDVPVNFNQGSMGGYLTYQEVLDELDDMRAQYPNLISAPENISDFLTEGNPDDSVTPSIGGNGIKWVRISDNPDIDEDEAEILYTSIHHAREPISLMQNIFYMWYLLENYDTDPEIKAIVDHTELYFVPVINPDGYLYNEVIEPNGGGLWRKNRNGSGVDNNRNYDYHIDGDPSNGSWGGPGSSSNPESATYHGAGPFSEVENQAIKWFVEQHNFIIAVNNHTFGNIYYYPFGYADVATPDDDLYQGFLSELGSQNGFPPVRDSPFSGESDDYMYGTVGTHEKIYAFTPEIGNTFWPAASQIEPLCIGQLYKNITAAQMVNNFAKATIELPQFLGNNTVVSLPLEIQRLGLNGSGNFTVSIEAVTDNITSTSGPIMITDLGVLDTQNETIVLNLDSTITPGSLVGFNLIVNNGTYDRLTRYEALFGSPAVVFEEAGESTTEAYEANDWDVITTTFVSAPSAITDSANGNYANNTDSSITIAESIDLSEAVAANLSFYTRYNIETNWDYVQLEISTDNGATWEPQCTALTTTGNENQALGEPLYEGVRNTWTFEQVDLSAYLGTTIKARFQLVSDDQVTRDGFYFDDLTVEVLREEDLNVDEDAFAKAYTLYPNPVKNTLLVATMLKAYTVTVYSALGQKMLEIQAASATEIDTSKLVAGIYFVQITAEGKTSSSKLIKQ